MDLGSWFTQSSLSPPIYGDDHAIDNKSKYNCHALMKTLWQLYVQKHIVERSTNMCLLVSPSCKASVVLSLHHIILLPFYPRIKDAFYTVHVTRLGHPLPTYIVHIKENIS
jgi:hypothetical protein